MRTELALLPSPLLGPAVWEPVAEILRQQGWAARICPAPTSPISADDVLDSWLRALPPGLPVALVPHSNAGMYIPRLCEDRNVVGNVFVDAALPPAEGSATLAPPALYDFLAERAGPDGFLPPWTQWWDSADVAGLFPDEAVRRRVETEQPRVPLTYFRSSLEVRAGWTDIPSAFLAFGNTYADERRQAATWDWPVTTLAGRHLHMLIRPEAVAEALTAMLAVLRVRRG